MWYFIEIATWANQNAATIHSTASIRRNSIFYFSQTLQALCFSNALKNLLIPQRLFWFTAWYMKTKQHMPLSSISQMWEDYISSIKFWPVSNVASFQHKGIKSWLTRSKALTRLMNLLPTLIPFSKALTNELLNSNNARHCSSNTELSCCEFCMALTSR